MKHELCGVVVCLVLSAGGLTLGLARVPLPVADTYEDTVRVAVLWNRMPNVPDPAGDAGPYHEIWFALSALEGIANVKYMRGDSANVGRLQQMWPGKNPHVVVHLNNGCADDGCSTYGGGLPGVYAWAAQSGIGVTEIGDDCAYCTGPAFGWAYNAGVVGSNLPAPMFTARWLDKQDDSLWVGLDPERDTFCDTTDYPYLTGIVRNAALKMGAEERRLFFLPVPRRGEADPDSFEVPDSIAASLHFLGYQQGWNATVDSTDAKFGGVKVAVGVGLVGVVDQFVSIAVLQDTTQTAEGLSVRRAVALSFEPRFLADSIRAKQILYDAVMFSSLCYTVGVTHGAADSREQPSARKLPYRSVVVSNISRPAQRVGIQATFYDIRGRSVSGAFGRTLRGSPRLIYVQMGR